MASPSQAERRNEHFFKWVSTNAGPILPRHRISCHPALSAGRPLAALMLQPTSSPGPGHSGSIQPPSAWEACGARSTPGRRKADEFLDNKVSECA